MSTPPERPEMKTLAVGYFYLQGVAGLMWWSAMTVWPEIRMWFEGDGGGILFGLFPLADLFLFAGGSLLAARALSRNSNAALPLCWTVTGAVLYSLIGAVMWQVWVRPVEEADLSRRFGPEYEAYRKRVTCWIPTFKRQK